MQKSIEAWLNELPIEVRNRAIERHDKYMREFYTKRVLFSSLHSALLSAFIWDDTPEKYDFWNKVYNELP